MRRLSVESFHRVPFTRRIRIRSLLLLFRFRRKRGRRGRARIRTAGFTTALKRAVGWRRGEKRQAEKSKNRNGSLPFRIKRASCLIFHGSRACLLYAIEASFLPLSLSHLFFSEEEDSAKKRDVQQRNRATIVSSRARTRRREERK